MAADQVACPFFGVVFEILNSLIYNVQNKELGPLAGLVKELKKLFKTFIQIKEVLDDAEEKQFNEKADRVGFWLYEMNDAAYEAHDVLAQFEYEALQQLASEGASSRSNNVTEQLHGKIQKVIEIFHDLSQECLKLKLKKGKEKSVVTSPDSRIDSLLTERHVYGRGADRDKVVKFLLGSSQENISVFSILSMGGLGKTTITQQVYNDKRVENHFEVRSWVCVSDDFDIKRIVKAFIASVSESECDLEDLELLQRRLQMEVHGKRFLLVLDDAREERQEKWNKLKSLFRSGAQGSSIIVTTRLETVTYITSKDSDFVSRINFGVKILGSIS